MNEREWYSRERAYKRFGKPKSELYERVVEDLGQLADAEGLYTAIQAYGEAMSPRLMESWCEEHIQARGVIDIRRLRGRPRDALTINVPGGDHCSLWGYRPSRRLEEVVSQPYGLDTEDVLAIADSVRDLNLRVSIGTESWHYPGRTLLVVFYRPEDFARRMDEQSQARAARAKASKVP